MKPEPETIFKPVITGKELGNHIFDSLRYYPAT